MAELIREIEEEDIPKLKELMTLVFQDAAWTGLKRLGGMTNHSYQVTRPDGREYLLRIPGEGTEEMISRSDEGLPPTQASACSHFSFCAVY